MANVERVVFGRNNVGPQLRRSRHSGDYVMAQETIYDAWEPVIFVRPGTPVSAEGKVVHYLAPGCRRSREGEMMDEGENVLPKIYRDVKSCSYAEWKELYEVIHASQ